MSVGYSSIKMGNQTSRGSKSNSMSNSSSRSNNSSNYGNRNFNYGDISNLFPSSGLSGSFSGGFGAMSYDISPFSSLPKQDSIFTIPSSFKL